MRSTSSIDHPGYVTSLQIRTIPHQPFSVKYNPGNFEMDSNIGAQETMEVNSGCHPSCSNVFL